MGDAPAPSQFPLDRASGLTLVANTPKGRGVFASAFIAKGTIIEQCPVLIFSQEEVEKHTSKTSLDDYTYYWPTLDGKLKTQALTLGLGSMFNHSRKQQNVVWSRDVAAESITYKARRDIQVGEELCISYGNETLWFEDADGVDSDDEYNIIAANKVAGKATNEVELSGLGNIEL